MAGYSPLSEDPALIATGNSIGLECLLPRLLGVAVDKTAGDVINDRRSRIQPLASNVDDALQAPQFVGFFLLLTDQNDRQGVMIMARRDVGRPFCKI